jgi:DNA-binding MarR family transcriptional regulator
VERSDSAAKTSGQLDEELKELMAAIAEFSSLLRRPEPAGQSRLALGRIMQQHGLEQRHATALLTVALYGPMTVTELARRHHVSVKTSSLIAVQLQQAGLIERGEDPADRRRTILTIAGNRERAIYAGLGNRAAHLRRALDRLTPTQRKGLITGLRVLAEEMERARGAP